MVLCIRGSGRVGKEMDMVYRFGPWGPNMKASGKMTGSMGLAHSYTVMETCIEATG